MKDVDLKKIGTFRLFGGVALVALATWGVWAFCGGAFSASNGWEPAFDGWRYGREDQKAASAALAAAGLDEWSWDDGRLLIPKNKKNEYQTALAGAGAYPKAPSESRRDAIREMGAFESDAKIRMRELAACASQLEQTLEQIGGIEYATVGVRARREQAGLTAKTVVTASIGVACREGAELDSDLLSAITVAAKHHLGVEANENLSILDLRAGKSYFGSEKSVDNGNELALALERERVENYWRDKLTKTFDYMGGVRVSVAAELVDADSNDVVRRTNGDELDDLADCDRLGDSNSLDDSDVLDVLGVLDDSGRRDVRATGTKRRVGETATKEAASRERAASAAERLARVEIEKIGEAEKPRPLATWSSGGEKSARKGGAFARLGNPVATRAPAAVEAQNLAEVERTSVGNGVLLVGATERRDAPKRGVVPAGYRQVAENEEDEQIERIAQAVKEETSQESATNARIAPVAQNGKKKENGANLQNGKNGENEGAGNEEKKSVARENGRFRTRALAVRVGTPRGYVRRVAQNLKAENAVETFANDETSGDWSVLYRTTEQKIIAETKNVALLLLRPFAERNGWTEEELARSVVVDVFTDPDDFVGRLNGDERDGGENPSGAVEVFANFGRIADTSERVAEETTLDETTAEESQETASERVEEKAADDFWTFCKARVRRLDAKTKASVAAVAVGGAILTLTAGAITARRRRKTNGALDEDEEEGEEKDGDESEKKRNDAKRTVARNKEKKKNRKGKRNASNGEDGEKTRVAQNSNADERQEREKRTVGRSLGIARIKEKTQDAQNSETESGGEETGPETETRGVATSSTSPISQVAQVRRSTSSAQSNVGVEPWDERKKTEGLGETSRFGGFDDFGDFDGADDWDELDDDLLEIRSLIERERARVEDEATETGELKGGGTSKSVGDATRRREALDFVARNPERAAASLQRWLRPGV